MTDKVALSGLEQQCVLCAHGNFCDCEICSLYNAKAALREKLERESAKPLTKADRIRAMSDEELADLLGDLYVKAWNDGHDGTEGEPYYHDWVAEPAEEEHHE